MAPRQSSISNAAAPIQLTRNCGTCSVFPLAGRFRSRFCDRFRTDGAWGRHALGGIAKDALPGAVRGELAIEVSDAIGKPLLRASLWFEVQVLT